MADKILIGPDLSAPLFTFTDAEIHICDCILSSALVMDELAVDELRPTVYSAAYIHVCFAPDGSDELETADGCTFMVLPGEGYLDELPYGTPIWYYSGDVMMGKFYTKRVVRSGKTWFDIQAVSAIGILDGQTHNGGMYKGSRFADVAADVIGGAVPFTVADDVASIPVFNWLPKASRRKNLHQLLFAYGAALKKDNSGNMIIYFPGEQTAKSIADNRIFLGGSVDFQTPASRVDITEHAFYKLPSDEIVTLFDNTDGSGVADHTTVDFRDAPIYNIVPVGGLTVHESGVNYAVISGTGILTGKKYTHTTKIISMDGRSSGEEKTVSVTDATLVSVTNSEYVARRVLSFYSSARTISADIVVDGEKPGDQIAFNDPFDEPATAFLSSMDIHSGSFLRAACELITNYTPKWSGNVFSHVVILTGSGTWQKPAGVEQCRAVLVGAGSGGSSGGNGESATGGFTTIGTCGEGGVPGPSGLGGKILSVAIDLKSISSIQYACGIGGLGGEANGLEPVQGAEGGATTFGSFSSANGPRSDSGCVNLFTGAVYGLPGVTGLPGGKGSTYNSDGDPVTGPDGTVYYPGQRGQAGKYESSSVSCGGDGGNGGGAAVGSNGGDGGNGIGRNNGGNGFGEGGNGGKGANAAGGADGASYGSGGSGGHGGGGGGTGGASYNSTGGDSYRMNGNPGAGGIGGRGGKGADGCVILYY